jgi:hypothetical protein
MKIALVAISDFSPAIWGGNQMTIGELRDELDEWPESFEIIFGCPELEFYRLKKRAGDLLQLEFNQTIALSTTFNPTRGSGPSQSAFLNLARQALMDRRPTRVNSDRKH